MHKVSSTGLQSEVLSSIKQGQKHWQSKKPIISIIRSKMEQRWTI